MDNCKTTWNKVERWSVDKNGKLVKTVELVEHRTCTKN